MNALDRLDAALDALDGALRGLKGPGARRVVERRVRRVLDERYGGDQEAEPHESGDAGDRPGELSELETRVLTFIEGNPRASARALRDGVGGDNRAIDTAVSQLMKRGLVRDTGPKGRCAYEATTERLAARPSTL